MFAELTNRGPRILVLEALAGSSKCVENARGDAVTVNATNARGIARALKAGVQGIVLTGGSDVNPGLYGETPDPTVYGVNHLRDSVELAVLDAANDIGVPVLGICRGSQIMNVWAGGSLYQDIGRSHWGVDHKVQTARSSVARYALGSRPLVASFHHQEVREPGKNFHMTAWSVPSTTVPVECVETIESDNGLMLGVQFHPEMVPERDHSKRVWAWLVAEARRVTPGDVQEDVLRRLEALVPAPEPKPAVTVLKSTKGQRRAARKAAVRALRVMDEYELSRVCGMCGMDFDKIEDRLDHEEYYH